VLTIEEASTGCWSKKALLPSLLYHPFCPIRDNSPPTIKRLVKKSRVSLAISRYFLSFVAR